MSEKYKSIFSTMGYCVRTMFCMDKRYSLLMITSLLIGGIVPIINANLVSSAINLAVNGAAVGSSITVTCVLLGILTVCQCANVYVMWYRSNHYISMGHMFDIIVAKKTLDMKYENAENPRIAELRMRAAKGCSAVPRIAELITEVGADILKMTGSAAILTMFHPLILLVVIPVAAINYFASNFFQKRHYNNEKREYKPRRRVQYFIETMLDYVAGKEIRIFSASDFIKEKYCKQEEELYGIHKNTEKCSLANNCVSLLLICAQLLFLYLIVGKAYFEGAAQIADVVLYINLVLVFSNAFSGIFGSFISIGWQGERLKDFREYVEIDDDKHMTETVHFNAENITITFDHVWFRYAGTQDYVLKDVSFQINNRQKVAIVGENGSGKTTLVKLLMRFYSPTKGRILINGIDYMTIAQEDYYRLFSTVFQNFHLLAYTIRENIHPRLEACDEKKFAATLKKLDMSEKVNHLPKGAETYITQEFSQEGLNFSGGELQKLAICRAIYKEAQVLILDEPTSALDPIAEKALYDDLYGIVEDKIMIMISHRLQSTSICDYILFMDKGTVAEEGAHDALMKKNGVYSKMYMLQAKWYV